MRLTVAVSAIDKGANTLIGSRAHVSGCAMGSLEILIGTALMIGFLTPIAGACASLGNLANSVSSLTSGGNTNAIIAAYLVVICIAITLLGPGAFSLDARLFGRREIIIPGRPRPPNQ